MMFGMLSGGSLLRYASPQLVLPGGVTDRQVVAVTLHKCPTEGIGITIVGTENTGHRDLGIFVKSVTPGGAAARNGCVRPGDLIIAINGQSLEGVQHHVAVDLIRRVSTSDVHLVLSQDASFKSHDLVSMQT